MLKETVTEYIFFEGEHNQLQHTNQWKKLLWSTN